MRPCYLLREALNKSAFYGEPAQLCDVGINKIKVLAPLLFPQKFPHLFNQRFLSHLRAHLHKLCIGLRVIHYHRLFIVLVAIVMIDNAVANSCYPLNSAQIIFGNYSPEFSQDLDMDTTIDIYCAPAFQGQRLNVKVNILGKDDRDNRRILQNTSGQDKAYFLLFQDSARTVPLLNNMSVPVVESLPHSKIFTIRLYGRLLAKQDIGKGIYTSNFIINIDY